MYFELIVSDHLFYQVQSSYCIGKLLFAQNPFCEFTSFQNQKSNLLHQFIYSLQVFVCMSRRYCSILFFNLIYEAKSICPRPKEHGE